MMHYNANTPAILPSRPCLAAVAALPGAVVALPPCCRGPVILPSRPYRPAVAALPGAVAVLPAAAAAAALPTAAVAALPTAAVATLPTAAVGGPTLCDSKDGVSLFVHTSGVAAAPAADADSTVRSQWTTRDATIRLAVRSHLPFVERAHFSQYKTARTLYDAVVARYSSPATAALSRLLLLYLFPDLAAFATVADLITHLRTSDTRYHAALPAEFCAADPPPMYITLHYLVTRLPDSLRSVRDHFLSLCPTTLTIDLLEERLLAADVTGSNSQSKLVTKTEYKEFYARKIQA
ncbi:unnamed protein product [Closterium sp. NIES-54]